MLIFFIYFVFVAYLIFCYKYFKIFILSNKIVCITVFVIEASQEPMYEEDRDVDK